VPWVWASSLAQPTMIQLQSGPTPVRARIRPIHPMGRPSGVSDDGNCRLPFIEVGPGSRPGTDAVIRQHYPRWVLWGTVVGVDARQSGGYGLPISAAYQLPAI